MFRRSFIQNTILGTLGASILKPVIESSILAGSTVEGNKFFMSESGIYGKDSTFILGFLKVSNPEIYENDLLMLRETTGYRTNLTYRSNDRHKIEFAKAAIDLIVSSNDFKFFVKYSDISNEVGDIGFKLSAINQYKIDLVNELNIRMGETPQAIVSKYQSLNGPSETFRSRFKAETGVDHNMEITRDSNLLQLSSYLTSTVAAIINDKINHPIKLEVTEYFKTRTGVTNFDNTFSQGNINFYK